MHTRLAIPLRQNPTRQATWRVVGTLAFLASAAVIGFTLYRFFLYQSTPVLWPAEATSAIRVIKTPGTQSMIQKHFANIPVVAGAPWTVKESFSWTNRQFVVFFQNDTPIGLVIDDKLPVSSKILEEMGLEIQVHNRQTLVYRASAAEPNIPRHQFTPRLIFPWFHGVYVQKNEKGVKNAPFSLTKNGLKVAVRTLANEKMSAPLSVGQETVLLASVHVPAAVAAIYLPEHVPLTLPGFSAFLPHLREQGLDFMIGEDASGISIMIATASPHFSLETMGTIAREGLQSNSLSTIALTLPNLIRVDEIRSLSEVEITASSENDLSVVTAKDANNRLFRLTQSDEVLILSNRPPVISPTLGNKSLCLPRAAGFIRPKDLAAHLPFTSSYLSGPISIATHASEVAWNKKVLKICW